MPAKRKRGTAECKSEDPERSPTPTSVSSSKKRKKELQYDPVQPSTSHTDDVDIAEIIQELFETIRNYKSEEGKLLCESFIRIPKRRTNPDYYEVVTQPMDMLKIQQKMKMDEYEEIEQLTADVELMVNNARAYYKKGSQEYIDATDLLDLYYEIRDELLVETFGDNKSIMDDDDEDGEPDDANVSLEQLQSKIANIVQQEGAKLKGLPPPDGDDENSCDPEDLEGLFAAVANAQDGDRTISEPFHLLPYKTLYPNYYDVIKEPIDLKMIAKKIQDNEYRSFDDMDRDIALMVHNAKTFNEPKSLIYKDACTLKKVFDVKKRELEHRKSNAKSSERHRKSSKRRKKIRSDSPKRTGTRGTTNVQKLTAQFAALEYPEPIDPTDIMEYEEDSGAETVMSEEENPMWHLFNAVKNYTTTDGLKIIDPYMKLPSKRYYPDYYEEIKKPLSVINVQKKLKTGGYAGLDDLYADLNLVFENAKRYNADESIIFKNSCLLQKVMREKKKELEKFGYKEMSIPELGIHFEFPMLKSYDEDLASKKTKKSLTPLVEPEKKRGPPKKTPFDADELLRKRLMSLYKSVYDYADSSGRLLRQIFMYLPSKKDYPDYYKVITDPIDLSIIEAKIKGNKYPSEYNLMSDFDLMFKNARHYNEEGSQVYTDAITLEKALKAKWRVINQAAGTPRPGKSKTRKGPAPTTLASRLQELYESIRDYQDARGRTLSSPFMKVPAKADYPDYYEVIKKPMDMSSISQKMLLKRYESLEDMVADFVQMFDNACKYNEPDSLIYKDALTLQRVCLEKKVELSDDFTNEVPDVRAVVQEMMTNLFIATYNHQDEEGRCYSDSFSELPERDPGMDPNAERPLSFDKIKRNLDRGRYRRMDRFQDDMFKVFSRARALSRSDSQLYEDTVEMQMFFIKTRDSLCKNGEILLTPALSFTEKHIHSIVEAEKLAKSVAEQAEDEKKTDVDETPQVSTDGEGNESLKYKDQIYRVGDFVYIEPRLTSKSGRIRKRNSKYLRDSDSEPHIFCIEKIYTDSTGQQQVYGNWFYRPNETFHLATRKFLQKEVLKSDCYASTSPNQIIGTCFVMNVREYFKYKPEGFADNDVYVCEFRYTSKTRSFKKIKLWSVPRNEDLKLIEREVPFHPIRVASIFADKDKDEFDDGDTSILDKERNDVLVNVGAPNEDGQILYEQMSTTTGVYKVGDCVYVKSDLDKPMIYRIDRMWADKYDQRYFYGPLFIRPCDIEHPPTRLFYKNEMFICGVEEARTMDSVTGRCCVLHVRDYCSSRPTEVPESDVYICESKYHETEKTVRRLSKGLKKHSLSPRVTDDEILFFRKQIIPTKVEIAHPFNVINKQEPSPLLVKASEENLAYDGDESRDTFTTDTQPEILNESLDEYGMPIPAVIKTPHTTKKVEGSTGGEGSKKKVEGSTGGEGSKKKGKGMNWRDKNKDKRTQISGYIVFSGEFRKIVQQENPECNFGEISRLVGGKWRNLEKEEKEKYEDKARRIAEEQQAKQADAERAFNMTLQQQQPQQQQHATPAESPRPSTPAQQGYPGYYSGYNVPPQGYSPSPGPYGGPYAPSPGGQFAPLHPQHPGMMNGMGAAYMSPQGQKGSPAMMQNGQRPPFKGQLYQSPGGPGMRPMGPNMSPYPGMTSIPYGQTPPVGAQAPHTGAQLGPYPSSPAPHPGMVQAGMHVNQPAHVLSQQPGQQQQQPQQQPQQQQQQQQMAPPPPPPRPASPMFVTVPPRTQRLLHSEAYLKYIEGLNSENRTITEWEKTFTATPENTTVPDESRLPTHWLGQGAGYHGSVTDALWAMRDLMLKDALSIQRTLPFEAL
ncbi:protein polybromo-1-like isoform X6 [Mercenaria mercenaria]|uniref:protein polybromo-1-like isoform X6 n=1 Tax=Mercenaria mercenaria TaxID=6596 RepID=UPI00234F6C2D|nr:protein polybromo-1-like isoform X6 [Mercenaria mercenaria]